MHSNMYTKIYEIVNSTTQEVTQEFIDDFMKEYNPKTYSSKENYGYSCLEFILKRRGIAEQRNWQHDSIFKILPDVLIDWKRLNPMYRSASITSRDRRGNSTRGRDHTHYGFININGNPFKLGDTLSFDLVALEEKDYVWDNPSLVKNNYFTFSPKKRK